MGDVELGVSHGMILVGVDEKLRQECKHQLVGAPDLAAHLGASQP